MEIWLPIRLGEMRKYIFGYPANIDIDYIFPPITDQAGGTGSGTIDDASGNLGNGITYKVVQVPFKRTHPSDRFDSTKNNNIPPVITTTGPYPGGSSVVRQSQLPSYDYRFDNQLRQSVNFPAIITTEMVIGRVVSKDVDSSNYLVRIFPKGLQDSTGSIEVEANDPNEDSNIPDKSFVYVMRQTTINGNNSTVKYTITGGANPGAFVGEIVSQIDENTYLVDVYFSGPDENPESVEVEQRQIEDGETFPIPDGTSVQVLQSAGKYYMQVTVLL